MTLSLDIISDINQQQYTFYLLWKHNSQHFFPVKHTISFCVNLCRTTLSIIFAFNLNLISHVLFWSSASPYVTTIFSSFMKSISILGTTLNRQKTNKLLKTFSQSFATVILLLVVMKKISLFGFIFIHSSNWPATVGSVTKAIFAFSLGLVLILLTKSR